MGKLEAALPTADSVEKRLRHVREIFPCYVRTLERLKAYRMKEQITSKAR